MHQVYMLLLKLGLERLQEKDLEVILSDLSTAIAILVQEKRTREAQTSLKKNLVKFVIIKGGADDNNENDERDP